MTKLVRFGVSLEKKLLDRFDALCKKKAYTNRSEALRDLIREALLKDEHEHDSANVTATLTFVYDHHKAELVQLLTSLQHTAHHLIVAALHVHLNSHDCLEVLVLKGASKQIKDFAQRLLSTKNVAYGQLVLASCTWNPD